MFGVPLAHEDDPERAVRAALRIIEDIGASDLGIEVRIGVNTGEALVRLDVDPRSGEGFATGDTMNTAARLEAAAPVMGVAVGSGDPSGERRERSSTRSSPRSRPRARQNPSRHGGRFTPPPGSGPRSATALRSWGETSSCRCSPSSSIAPGPVPRPSSSRSIAEPGLGKSRLVRELARHVDQLPELVTWREGRCLPYGDGISFWALGEIVKAQAGILETDDQQTISAKLDQVTHRARSRRHGAGSRTASPRSSVWRRTPNRPSRRRRSPHGDGSWKRSREPVRRCS